MDEQQGQKIVDGRGSRPDVAAVLVRAAVLRDQGHSVSFCTLDGDLQPWTVKVGAVAMAHLFDGAGVWLLVTS
jgi:hypothetical protein